MAPIATLALVLGLPSSRLQTADVLAATAAPAAASNASVASVASPSTHGEASIQHSLAVPEGPAELVIVLGTRRSASTSMSFHLAQDDCAVSFDELLKWSAAGTGVQAPVAGKDNTFASQVKAQYGHMFPDPAVPVCTYVDGGCNGKLFKDRTEHIEEVFPQVRAGFCSRDRPADEVPLPSCNGACTVVIKVHDYMIMSTPAGPPSSPLPKDEAIEAQKASITKLFGLPGVRVVVNERLDMQAEQCSYNYSTHTNSWHFGDLFGGTHEDGKAEWQKQNCEPEASAKFVEEHNEWFAWVRETLATAGTPTLEMTSEELVSDTETASAKLTAFAGLTHPGPPP